MKDVSKEKKRKALARLKRKVNAEVQVFFEQGLATGEPVKWSDQALANLKQEIFRRKSRQKGS
jgi:hypothetical protein